MSKKTIAIIGGTSFIIQHFIRKYNYKYEFIFFSRKSSELLQNNGKVIKFDLPVNEPNISELLKADAVILSLADGVQNKDCKNLDTLYYVNTFFPIKVINSLSKNNFKGKIITFGTYFEIGTEKKPYKYDEESLVFSKNDLINHYCLSKKMLSTFIYNNLNKLDLTHLILPTIYGPGENKNRLIPYIIDSIKKTETIYLTSGKQYRQYLSSWDLGDLLDKVLNLNIKSGIYNVPSEITTNIINLAIKVTSFFNYNGKIKQGGESKSDVKMPNLFLDSKKIKKHYNWSPKCELENILKEY
jgi:nucleoside-diphosphate-sugar epimerase